MMSDRRDLFRSIGTLFGSHSRPAEAFLPPLPNYIAAQSSICGTCEEASCMSACEEKIVVRTNEGKPYLDFSSRGCTLCNECIDTCGSEVFDRFSPIKIDAAVSIGILGCLAWNKVICRSCADACDVRAIEFTGLWHPTINKEVCTACGFCIGRCPTAAITVSAKETV